MCPTAAAAAPGAAPFPNSSIAIGAASPAQGKSDILIKSASSPSNRTSLVEGGFLLPGALLVPYVLTEER